MEISVTDGVIRGRSCRSSRREDWNKWQTDSENRYTEQSNRRGLSGTGHSLLKSWRDGDTSLEDSFRFYKEGNGASEILQ